MQEPQAWTEEIEESVRARPVSSVAGGVQRAGASVGRGRVCCRS